MRKEIPIPVIGLVGFVAGFVCLTLAGRALVRYQKKCIKRTMNAIAEELQKGFSLYDEAETEEIHEDKATEAE